MLNPVSFQSERYIEIHWKTLFDAAAVKVSEASLPMGLVNSDGLVMVTDSIYSLARIGICFENDTVQVLHDHLDTVPFYLSDDSGILFFRLSFENISSTVSHLYLKFINQIVCDVYDVCLKMFIYTYEHLGNRQYNNQSMQKIATIQCQFSETYCILESVKCVLSDCNSKEKVHCIIEDLLAILNQIARLGGARAILKNNAIELMFHLKLFQQFISSSR